MILSAQTCFRKGKIAGVLLVLFAITVLPLAATVRADDESDKSFDERLRRLEQIVEQLVRTSPNVATRGEETLDQADEDRSSLSPADRKRGYTVEDGDRIFAFDHDILSGRGRISAIDRHSQKTLWQTEVADLPRASSIAVKNDRLTIRDKIDGRSLQFDVRTGQALVGDDKLSIEAPSLEYAKLRRHVSLLTKQLSDARAKADKLALELAESHRPPKSSAKPQPNDGSANTAKSRRELSDAQKAVAVLASGVSKLQRRLVEYPQTAEASEIRRELSVKLKELTAAKDKVADLKSEILKSHPASRVAN